MQQHVSQEWFQASTRADELLTTGDLEGHAMVTAIL